MRGVGDEVLAHRLETHLPRNITDEQQLLSVAVRNHLQRQVAILAGRRADDDRTGEVRDLQISRELRRAQQVFDSQAQVGRAAQVEQTCGHPVEPDDFALCIENDDAIRQRSGRALQLAHELHEALLMETLAPMQTNDLRNDLAKHAADIGRIGEAAVAQPPFQAKQVDELPAQVQGERDSEPDPDSAEQPAQHEAHQDRAEKPAHCEPPSLCRWLHGN